MATQNPATATATATASATASTAQPISLSSPPSHTQSAAAAPSAPHPLLRLPTQVVELVLQHLDLRQQLNGCSSLCRRFPLPNARSIHYASLVLTDDSVRRLSQSHRLWTLLTSATRVVLVADCVPAAPARAVQFLLAASGPAVGRSPDTLFPQLTHFTYRLSATDLRHRPPSLPPLLPFLSSRNSTLRSVRLDCHRHQPHALLGSVEVEPLLAPLTELRQLKLTALLSRDSLGQLLAKPLVLLDLADSSLYDDKSELQLESIAGCALLRSVRVLRLPQYSPLSRSVAFTLGGHYLDAIVQQRLSDTLPHTLAVRHALSVAAAQHLIDLPPSHSLSVRVDSSDTPDDVFLPHATTRNQHPLADLPCQLQLCLDYSGKETKVLPAVEWMKRHPLHVGSVAIAHLPEGDRTTEVFDAISHCAHLSSLRLSSRGSYSWPRVGRRTPLPTWEGRALSHLHTVTLVHLTKAETLQCRLLSACPALRICILTTLDLSVGMLNVLSASCPLLSHLQLRIENGSTFAERAPTAAEERSRPASPFPSLVHLDVQYATTHNGRHGFLVVLGRMHPYVLGGPLRQLTLTLGSELQQEAGATPMLQYETAVTPLLLALPRLEKLTVARECRMTQRLTGGREVVRTAWDDEEDVGRTGNGTAAPSLPSRELAAVQSAFPSEARRSSASLRSLDLIISSDLLPLEDLSALLTRCPAVTSVKLTVRNGHHSALLHFLHCLARIGLHCPLVEDVTYRLDHSTPPTPTMSTSFFAHSPPFPTVVQVLNVGAVRGVVDAHQLPDAAFGRLLHLFEVGPASEVLSDEAAEYVRQQWMRSVRGVSKLMWHRPSSPAPKPSDAAAVMSLINCHSYVRR